MALLVATAVAVSAVQAPAQPEVLVAGHPPLTRDSMDRFTNFIEWLLDVPLTVEQRTRLEVFMRESWERNDPEDMAICTDILRLEAEVVAMEPDQRLLAREQLQPAVLEGLRGDPKDEASRWLLGIYDGAHRPIAQGQPPLTRQMTNSFVEFYFFMLAEAVGRKLDVPPELSGKMATFLADGYPRLSATEQGDFARMPLIWAAFRVAWPVMTDEEKAPYRQQFTKMFKPYLDKVKRAAAAAQAEQAKAQARAQAQASTQAAAKPRAAGTGRTNTPQQAYAVMSAQSHYRQMVTNAMRLQAQTGRAIVANIGPSYTYQYHY